MPVEHEYKYILDDNHPDLMLKLAKGYPQQNIQQTYVTKNNRVRCIVKDSKKKQSVKYYHTFKKKINEEVLEIESEISPEDFGLIQRAENNLGNLHKIRFTIKQVHGQWDVDFLLTDTLSNGGTVYFAMAECEQPKEFEVVVPDSLRPYIKYEVPYEHSNTFSNFKMCDREYAATAVSSNLDKLKEFEK